jgi:hypothetical protein
MHQGEITGVAVLLVLVVGPLLLGLRGVRSGRQSSGAGVAEGAPWDWKLSIFSSLLYALAFNLIFFVQEFFLVLPKALTPGLKPILYHNNHTWTGESPLAGLFQGTGALAIFVIGVVCILVLHRRPPRSVGARLFLIWMAYNGFMQSLPQVVIGSVEPENDVGMAMDYLHLGLAVKMLAALVALLVIPVVALSLRRPLLSAAGNPAAVRVRAGTRAMLQVATMPALAAILLIIPFRMPRNWVEVVAVPVVVTMGIAWIQAGAWAVNNVQRSGTLGSTSIAYAFAALLVLLLVFQFILKPGVQFF